MLIAHVNINAQCSHFYCYRTACRICQASANVDCGRLESVLFHFNAIGLLFFFCCAVRKINKFTDKWFFTLTKWTLTIFSSSCYFCSTECARMLLLLLLIVLSNTENSIRIGFSLHLCFCIHYTMLAYWKYFLSQFRIRINVLSCLYFCFVFSFSCCCSSFILWKYALSHHHHHHSQTKNIVSNAQNNVMTWAVSLQYNWVLNKLKLIRRPLAP